MIIAKCATIPNVVILGQTVWAGPQKNMCAGALKTHPPPHIFTMSNLVVLHQRLWT